MRVFGLGVCFLGSVVTVLLGSGCAAYSGDMLPAAGGKPAAAASSGGMGAASVGGVAGSPSGGTAGEAPSQAGSAGIANEPAGPADLGDAGVLAFVPWPSNVEKGAGSIELAATTRIVATTEALLPLARVLAEELELLTGLELGVTGEAALPGDIALAIDSSQKRLAYRFDVERVAEVTGGSYSAVAQGTSTLLQAVFEKDGRFGLPRLQVTDQPVPEYTGLMVDLARVYHSVDSLKQQIELCRLYRVEYLRWHLNDMESWTIPSIKYPLLGTHNWGAFGLKPPPVYTRAELDEVVAYADARGISLVPEVETPFHAGSIIAAYPELKWDGGHVHIAKEELYTFLDDVIGETADIFQSSTYIHVGGDEFSYDFSKLQADSPEFMAAHGITNLNDAIAYLATKLNEFVKKRGKKAMAWAPTRQAPKDLAMNVWGSNDDPQAWFALGFPVINTPAVPGWFETPRFSYEVFSLYKKEDRIISDTSNRLFLGADQVYWERGEERMMQYLRDTVAARAERTRNPTLGHSFDDFLSRFAKTDVILDKLLYRFTTRIEGLYQRGSVESDGKKDYRVPDGSSATVTMTPAVAGATIRYTTGNYTDDHASAVDPTASSKEYTAPITIAAGKSLQLRAALFDATGKQLGMTYRATFNGNLTRNLDGLW